MELIAKYKGLKLLRKYNQYYIRFIGGQYEEYPCDLHITDDEAVSILAKNEEIKTVRDSYKKRVKWSKEFFVDSGIKDYLLFEYDLSENEIQNIQEKLSRYEDIKMEFYETIMYGDFPKKGALSEVNFTAEKIKNSINSTIAEAYLLLIDIRENPASINKLH